MSNVINLPRTIMADQCSFCGAHKNSCSHFFSNQQQGAAVRYICNKCVVLAAKQIKEAEAHE